MRQPDFNSGHRSRHSETYHIRQLTEGVIKIRVSGN